MSTEQIIFTVINILAVLFSPIIALWISNKIQENKDKRNDKLWILKILMTQRAIIQDINYVNALNLIDLIFVNSSDVRKAYKALYNEYLNKGESFDPEKINRARTKLIETIVNDLGYKDKITWNEIQEPYVPTWLVDKIDKSNTIMDAQTNMATFINSITKPNNLNENNNQGKDTK